MLGALWHSPPRVLSPGPTRSSKPRNAPTPAAVRALLAAGADADARDVDGATPLLYAAHVGNVEIVRALLAAGADPNATNRYGVAPLHEASQVADAALIGALLDAGAEVDRALPEGETPLMLASRTSALAAVQLLIDRGANVNVVEQLAGADAAHVRGRA